MSTAVLFRGAGPRAKLARWPEFPTAGKPFVTSDKTALDVVAAKKIWHTLWSLK